MYTQLSSWHAHHRGRFAILLFPSDEFGEQERPASEIPAFVKQFLPVNEVQARRNTRMRPCSIAADGCSRVAFVPSLQADCHLMAKGCVNGPDSSPIWTAVKETFPGDVEWNFE